MTTHHRSTIHTSTYVRSPVASAAVNFRCTCANYSVAYREMANALPPTKMKKLPFKPTALRRLNNTVTASPKPDTTTTSSSSTLTANKSSSGTPAKDAAAVVAADDDDDGLALFRRRKEMEPRLAADREERMRRKQRKADKEKETVRRLSEAGSSSPQAKRVLQRDEEDNQDRNEEASPIRHGHAVSLSPIIDDDDRGTNNNNLLVTPPPSKRTRTQEGSSIDRLTGRSSRGDQLERDASPLTGRSTAAVAVEKEEGTSSAPFVLESDPEDDAVPAVITRQPRRRRSSTVPSITQPNIPDDDDDDEDIEKYIKMAEEKRARLLEQQSGDANAKPRKVDILINSPIPGTKPCQIKYYFDKALVPVRKAWIDRQQGVDLPDVDDLVLTWRCNKVYNNSSLLDLGIRPWGEYGVFADGGSSKGLDGTKVHLQIWTSKLLEEHLAAERLRRRREAGDLSDDDDDDGNGIGAAKDGQESIELVEERQRFRINLRARDYEEVGLTVLLETTAATLMTAFRARRSIPQDKEMTLRFDGDQLEEHVTMEEAGVDEMDTIEVHIK